MSTNNFHYTNRCIVVTNEQHEDPTKGWRLGEYLKGSLRGYDAFEIIFLDKSLCSYKEACRLSATKIIFSTGYYDAACLDFIQDEDKAYEIVADGNDYKQKPSSDDVLKIRADLLLKREARLANRILNRLKKRNHYDEVKKIAQFSNGEAMYERI